MKIRITDGNRGPKGAIHDVYLKVYSDKNWYIIPFTEGYHVDNSYVNADDEILYEHPDFNFHTYEALPEEFTFISEKDCEELVVKNNKEAKSVLTKEW